VDQILKFKANFPEEASRNIFAPLSFKNYQKINLPILTKN